jgi:hypothetical protein
VLVTCAGSGTRIQSGTQIQLQVEAASEGKCLSYIKTIPILRTFVGSSSSSESASGVVEPRNISRKTRTTSGRQWQCFINWPVRDW